VTFRAVSAQARMEILLTLRRGESVLATLGIPVGVLVFFSVVDAVDTGFEQPVDFLVPGVLALAVIATGMVSLGIATAFERRYAVLKRLGSTPLSRSGLVIAKTSGVLVVEVLQAAVIVGVAATLGWDVTGRLVGAAGVLLLGTVTFAGLGLLMAGTLKAELTLALTNLLYVAFVLVGGVAVPLARLPDWLETVAKVTPAAQLTEATRATLLGGAVPAWAIGGLVAWAVAAPVLAAAAFRWEE